VLAEVVDLATVDPAELAGLAAAADVLVVGCPTRAWGMSSPATGEAATARAGAAAAGTGLREWLAGLGPVPRGRPAAAFDTRPARPRALTGPAAAGAARHLRRLGYRLVDRPTSFRVQSSTGPLLAGELELARLWGAALVTRILTDAALGRK
jgi:hypothetical protein